MPGCHLQQIFTHAVANTRPGEKVTVTIKYVETLKYEEGAYEFVFPMVVAPRYIPGQPVSKQGGGWAPDTDRVDADVPIKLPAPSEPTISTSRAPPSILRACI